jgi:hypothetical protein
MKRTYYLLLFIPLWTSCEKQVQKTLTKQEIQNKIDSIVTIRLKEVDEQANLELNHRIKIEVKVKADSILQTLKAKDSNNTYKLNDTSQIK